MYIVVIKPSILIEGWRQRDQLDPIQNERTGEKYQKTLKRKRIVSIQRSYAQKITDSTPSQE